MRIGQGYDLHTLVSGRALILGGVDVPHDKGLLGHSDADVLTHAICDAILGACGLRDIGYHFPDDSEAFKDADSLILLQRVVQLASDAGFVIENIDATIIAEKPKLLNFIPDMCQNLCNIVQESGGTGAVNVKATTHEGVGCLGRGRHRRAERSSRHPGPDCDRGAVRRGPRSPRPHAP